MVPIDLDNPFLLNSETAHAAAVTSCGYTGFAGIAVTGIMVTTLGMWTLCYRIDAELFGNERLKTI